MPSESYRKYNKPTVLSGIEVNRAWLSESLVALHELNSYTVSTEGMETESIDQQITAITLHRVYHTPHKLVRTGRTAASLVVKKRQTLGQLSLILLEMTPSGLSSPVLTVLSITFGFPF